MGNTSPAKHVLSDALSVILPGPDDTLLLRACLDAGESGRQACESWLARQGDVTARGVGATPDAQQRLMAGDLARESVKGLLPLLFRAIRAHSVDVSNPFLTILKTASMREELRTRTYRLIAGRVLAALAAKWCRAIPIKGVVFGETVYPDPALRHSHDIEILVADSDPDEIGRLLIGLEFTPSGARPGNRRSEFTHSSGLPLVLHGELFEIPFYNAGLQEILSRAQRTAVLGASVQILSPADALLHTCGHAAYSVSRASHRWVGDAWFLIDRNRDLDWELLLDAAKHAHLALPLSVTLTYLAEQLNAPVPSGFLDRLAVTASKTRPIGRELALFGARRSERGGFRRLIRGTRNWQGRLYVVKWMLAPSPAYLSWVSGLRSSRLLPAQYLCRPARYLSRRARLTLKRAVRRFGRSLREPLKFRAALQRR